MGLSSSQARLLHLTNRMHQIEYKAQRIEAQKLQLANDSDKVYQTYLEELEATKIQYKALQEDGSITFHDATLSKLQELGYRFQIMGLNGFLVTHEDVGMYNEAIREKDTDGKPYDGSRDYFIAMKTGRIEHTNSVPGEDGSITVTSDHTATDGFTEIYTVAQLKESFKNGANKIRLMNDFVLDEPLTDNGNPPRPITFTGTLDGNGHTITLNCDNALFGSVTGSNTKVSNLNIINRNCKDKGVFANSITGGTYENISVSGNVTYYAETEPQNTAVGGFASVISGANVTNCSSNVNVSGKMNVGGFAGAIYSSGNTRSKIDNCVSNGHVQSQVTYTGGEHSPGGCISGGFAGAIANSDITNSVSNSSLTIKDGTNGELTIRYSIDSGGFAGSVSNVKIDHCASNGAINCSDISSVSGYDGLHHTNHDGQQVNGSNNKFGKTVGSFIGATASDTTINIIGCNTTSSINAGIVAISGFIGYVNPNGSGETYIKIDSCNSNVALSTQAQYYKDINDETAHNYDASANIIFSTGVDTQDEGRSAPNITITNFYTNNSTGGYDSWGSWNEGSEPTKSATPNQNTIYAAGAHTSTTQRLEGADANAAGQLFDEIESGNYFFEEDAEDFYLTDHWDDPVWLTNMINEGFLYLYKVDDKSGESYQVSVSTDTGLKEVQDEIHLKKAEAKYEADMRRIDMKDRKYDSDLAALDAERNATKEEMETLKTVAKDNVDRTFKLFS